MENHWKFVCMSSPFAPSPSHAAALRTSCFPAIARMEREKAGQHTGHRSAKLKSLKSWETESHATVQHTYRHGNAARSRQRRYGPDGAETISKGADARRIWPNPFLRLALPSRRTTES